VHYGTLKYCRVPKHELARFGVSCFVFDVDLSSSQRPSAACVRACVQDHRPAAISSVPDNIWVSDDNFERALDSARNPLENEIKLEVYSARRT
jgi:hypothetical protein